MENSGSVSKEKKFISAVVYIHNSEKSVGNFLTNIDDLLNRHFETYEFVLINDASEDKSLNVVKELSDSINGNVTVIDLAYMHGIEIAMLAGEEYAIGDYVIEFDSTVIDYDLELVSELYENSIKGYDIVAASPNSSTKYSSRLFYKYLNKISKRKMSLKTETFRIVSRRALNRVLRSKEKLRYRKALYHYSGFNTMTVDYDCLFAHNHRDNMGLREKMNLAVDVLIGFSNIGTRLPLNISILFAFVSIITIVYTIYSYFTVENIQAGWTTTMMFMSISFTGLFFVLAVILKYINVLLYELQDRPRYIYKTIDRYTKK